jgi:hypothetical protein
VFVCRERSKSGNVLLTEVIDLLDLWSVSGPAGSKLPGRPLFQR